MSPDCYKGEFNFKAVWKVPDISFGIMHDK